MLCLNTFERGGTISLPLDSDDLLVFIKHYIFILLYSRLRCNNENFILCVNTLNFYARLSCMRFLSKIKMKGIRKISLDGGGVRTRLVGKAKYFTVQTSETFPVVENTSPPPLPPPSPPPTPERRTVIFRNFQFLPPLSKLWLPVLDAMERAVDSGNSYFLEVVE